MRWLKHGLIFDPTRHALPNQCSAFAQSPQALVFDDHVRIYFSTRSVDPGNGKYLSYMAFVNFTKDFKEIIGVSTRTVLPLGELGCFDEHGIFPMHVLRRDGAVLAYTCGWSRRVSVSVETAIGLAVSHDEGLTFQRMGHGPILAASLHEPHLVGDPFVMHIQGRFHMWYIFGTAWKNLLPGAPPDRIYKIGHLESPDGLKWATQDGHPVVPDVLGGDECQALPTVVAIGNRFHMFFCFRHASDFRTNSARGYRIGHAWSDDLASWTREDDTMKLETSSQGWDSDMLCYPHAFEMDGRIFMLYNGNQFGRFGFGLAELV